jgi:hypothetical protein
MKYIDDIFDKRYLDETVQKLKHTAWYPTNVANSYTWPYYEKGSHKLLGDVFFERKSIDVIKYSVTNPDLSYELIDAYYAIMRRFERKLVLQGIYSNLQFMGMDGTPHEDSTHEDDYAYIWMLGDEDVDNEGGEFVNVTKDEIVPYKYGRVIEIRAKDTHYGKAFTTPFKCRMSFKFVGTDDLYKDGWIKVTRK